MKVLTVCSATTAVRRARDVLDPMGKDDAAFNDCAVLIEAGTALHVGPPGQ